MYISSWDIFDFILQYKKELAAKAAGFTFVHHKELQAAVVTSDEPADATEEGAAEYGSDVEISRAMAQSDLDHSDREDEESIPVQDTKSTAKSQVSCRLSLKGQLLSSLSHCALVKMLDLCGIF